MDAVASPERRAGDHLGRHGTPGGGPPWQPGPTESRSRPATARRTRAPGARRRGPRCGRASPASGPGSARRRPTSGRSRRPPRSRPGRRRRGPGGGPGCSAWRGGGAAGRRRPGSPPSASPPRAREESTGCRRHRGGPPPGRPPRPARRGRRRCRRPPAPPPTCTARGRCGGGPSGFSPSSEGKIASPFWRTSAALPGTTGAPVYASIAAGRSATVSAPGGSRTGGGTATQATAENRTKPRRARGPQRDMSKACPCTPAARPTGRGRYVACWRRIG